MKSTFLVALQIASLALLSVPAGGAAPPLPRGTEIQVDTDTTTLHYKPSVAVFPNGGFVVVWAAAAGARVRARLFDSLGRPTSGELPLDADDVGQVVADRDGSFLVVWSFGSVYVRRFNHDGTPRGPAIRASASNISVQGDPVAAIGADGRFAVAWQAEIPCCVPGGHYSSAIARMFTAKGSPMTREIVLLPGSPASHAEDDASDALPLSLALAPDGTLSAIAKIGPDCNVNYLVRVLPGGRVPSVQPLGSGSCSALFGSHGSLAMGLDGSLIATWIDFEIGAQRFAPNGVPRGDVFDVSQEPSEAQAEPAVALQAGGSFVIVWTEKEGRDGDGKGIFGRAFNSKGIPLSKDFQINVQTAGDQFGPVIAAPRQGPVLVVWSQSFEGRGDIFARVLSATP